MRYRCLLLLLLALSACTPRKTAPAVLPEPAQPMPPLEAAKSAEDFEFIVLQLNDVYEISPLANGRGGMARVSSLRRQLMDMNPNLITVLSGDYLSPSLIGSLKCNFAGVEESVAGRHMVEVMNATGIDYVTFGNHEFDIKEAEHLSRDNESKFKIISSNVLHQTKAGPVPFTQNGVPVQDHAVHTFHMPDGKSVRLGLVGVTVDDNKKDYVSYTNRYQSVDKSVAYLQSTKAADLIFGITHLTIDQDDTLAQKVQGMPLLFGGHDHVNMVRKSGNTTIYKADANAKTVWIHWCKYNTRTKALSTEHLLYPITEALPEDPNVTMITRKWERFADDCMRAQGYMPMDTIGFYLNPLDGREDAVRFRPTNFGTLIADAIRLTDPSIQVGLLNSGSIRLDDVLTGFVTQRDIFATLPFGGDIQKGNLKGSDLRRLLDAGLAQTIKGIGAYLQVSGVTVNGSNYTIQGKPLNDAQTYVVAMPGFLAQGKQPELAFVKDFCTYTEPVMQGGSKNNLRDIVILHIKRTGNMQLARQLLERQK